MCFFFLVSIIEGFVIIIAIIVQVNALLETLELTDSAQRKGHFVLYNCLVLGHTKYNGVQRDYCNQFPAKQFYCSHWLDHVMIQPPGIDNGAFVVSPESVWYARALLFFLPHHKPTPSQNYLIVHSSQPWKYMTIQTMVIIVIIVIIVVIVFIIIGNSLL